MFIVRSFYHKIYFQGLYVILILFGINFCSTVQKKESGTNENPETHVTEATSKVMDDFFDKEKEDDEGVRVFVSSDEYSAKQVSYDDSITFLDDTLGKKSMSDDIRPYDMVDMFSEAVYKVELFKDSGLISRIRPVKPSRISELNKIIIDDITRLKFRFKNQDKPEPLSFRIRYGIQLQKKKSNEEIKKILKENVH